MEINGLPLHPLVVHAAVVFGPLAALAGLGYALVPRFRGWLRWPFVVAAVLAAVFIWVSYLSGENLAETRFAGVSGEFAEKIETHEDYAGTLRLLTLGFGVVSIVAVVLHARRGALRALLSVLVVAGAVGVLVWTVLTGDAGAQLVYGA